MLLTHVGFVFLLLPAAAVAYYLTPNRFKTTGLMLLSALFYGMIDPQTAPWAILSVAADYAAVFAVWRLGLEGRPKQWLLEAFCFKNLVAAAIFGVLLPLLNVRPVPAGFLVICANAAIYLWLLRQEKLDRLDSFSVFGAYCLFFARLPLGPIGQTERLLPLLRTPQPSLSGIGQGVVRFTVGLAKRAIFAEQLILTQRALRTACEREFSVLGGWMIVLCSALILYFILSSYSDIAVGLAKIFSLELPRTVYFPFQSPSISDSVYRMNMALGDHVRAAVFSYPAWLGDVVFPLLLCVWISPSRRFLFWGGWMVLLLLLERFVLSRLPKAPDAFCRIGVCLISLSAYLCLLGGSFQSGGRLLWELLGLGGAPAANGEVFYVILSNGPLLALAAASSTSIFDQTDLWLAKRFPAVHSAASSLLNIGLMIVTTSFLLEYVS